MYLGEFEINEYVNISVACRRAATGAAYAPSSLTYSIYEEGNTTGLDEDVDMVPGNPFDSVVGFYISRRQLTSAAGFEAGKTYVTLIKATVDGVVSVVSHAFQIRATPVVLAALDTTVDTPDGGDPDTIFTITAGKASDDAYNNMLITVTDVTDGNIETRIILDYTSGRQVTLDKPLSFDVAAADTIQIWKLGYSKPVATDANGRIDLGKWLGSAVDSYTNIFGEILTDLNTILTRIPNLMLTLITSALDTAIPGSPTANSINQRIKAIDELTEESGTGDLVAMSVYLVTLLKTLQADVILNTTTTPWQIEFKEKGTATILFKKALKDIAGTNITASGTTIGQHIHTA